MLLNISILKFETSVSGHISSSAVKKQKAPQHFILNIAALCCQYIFLGSSKWLNN